MGLLIIIVPRISRWTIRLPHQTVVIRKAEYSENMNPSRCLEMDGGGLIHGLNHSPRFNSSSFLIRLLQLPRAKKSIFGDEAINFDIPVMTILISQLRHYAFFRNNKKNTKRRKKMLVFFRPSLVVQKEQRKINNR